MGIFRTINHIHRTTVAAAYPQEINEHRAPTDDSVQLLREMEEEARKSVLDVYRFEDTDLSGIVVLLKPRNPHDFDSRTLYIRFTLNGRTVELKEEIDTRLASFDKNRAYELLVHAVRDAILQKLLPSIGEAFAEEI